MKTFRVSVLCDCFATFELEAEDEATARSAAMCAGPHELEIETHTLTPKQVETVKVWPEAEAA